MLSMVAIKGLTAVLERISWLAAFITLDPCDVVRWNMKILSASLNHFTAYCKALPSREIGQILCK
jgi:hypothetical protein